MPPRTGEGGEAIPELGATLAVTGAPEWIVNEAQELLADAKKRTGY